MSFQPGIIIVIKHPISDFLLECLPIPYETDASFEWKKSDDQGPFFHPLGLTSGTKAIYIETVLIQDTLYNKLILDKKIIYVHPKYVHE